MSWQGISEEEMMPEWLPDLTSRMPAETAYNIEAFLQQALRESEQSALGGVSQTALSQQDNAASNSSEGLYAGANAGAREERYVHAPRGSAMQFAGPPLVAATSEGLNAGNESGMGADSVEKPGRGLTVQEIEALMEPYVVQRPARRQKRNRPAVAIPYPPISSSKKSSSGARASSQSSQGEADTRPANRRGQKKGYPQAYRWHQNRCNPFDGCKPDCRMLQEYSDHSTRLLKAPLPAKAKVEGLAEEYQNEFWGLCHDLRRT
ncbi:hypothetical protein LTR37_009837 [Vermiconidia calcicola]|uniref:Uncharacterized protein n=1 Tax=Vermiconidia calcicola TaxID=1690605 RepID=A0ACC3N7J8_9PEZI|nr:hypothetical protein LTR37_009837 [Vermiconidia calcicola]